MDESPGAQGGRVDPAAEAEALGRARRAAMVRSMRAGAVRSVKDVGRGTQAGARLAGRSGHASARLVGRGGRASVRRFRIFTHSGGAGESGLARLVELNAVNSAADAALTLSLAGTIFSIPTGEARGQVAGLSSQLARLSLDALVQRDVGEAVRTSVFAWSETQLQIAWVIGGGLGIALSLIPQLGFGVITALLVGTFLMAIRNRVARQKRKAAAGRPVGA